MAKKKQRKRKLKFKLKTKLLLVLLLIIVMAIIIYKNIDQNKLRLSFLGSNELTISLYNEKREAVMELNRGTEIQVYNVKLDDDYYKILYDKKVYYVKKANVQKDNKNVVYEKSVFVRTSYNLNKDLTSSELLSLCNKGDELIVSGYDYLQEDGNVNMYQVTTSKGETGYFYRKYVTFDKESSLKNYDEDGIYKTHATRKNKYGGGDAASLDYYPVIKGNFANNVMPDNVYSLYINGLKSTIKNIDEYIEYAKTTKINAFVVDIKDSGVSAYESLVMKEYSPTSYKYAQNSLENYQAAIKKIKDAGFYVIGRITTFKDDYYVSDNSGNSISNTSGTPLKHQSSYWPSAFIRDVWEYNVELAEEAVKLMGFNEIQFDYVRFPDGMESYEKNGTVNYRNAYNETKAQAIQKFLMYATNELHKLNVYVSCDVFGESSWGYVTAYGQYWPAMSNIVDVISAMPYTDHFGNTYGGKTSPWKYPYETVLTWAKTASSRQNEITSPAIARTWITAYNTPYWEPTVTYDGEKISDQVRALYDAGLTGGYMTWNSGSNLTKYRSQISGYNKEYN